MPQTTAAEKRKQRRIPAEFRKRNAQSCDWCRKRRCKCEPSQSGAGCIPCQQNNVPCSYTAPRKTRFYGSVDELSDRYRCLDAIVKGAFPNDETSTAAELVQLGKRMGYTMPDIKTPNRDNVKIEHLVRDPKGNEPMDTEPGPQPSETRHRSDEEGQSRDSDPLDPNWRPRTRVNSEEPHVSLIRDTSGNEHYIGPSGTLNFLSQLRRLVDTESVSSPAATTSAVSTGAAKFTHDDAAQALEANEEHAQKDLGQGNIIQSSNSLGTAADSGQQFAGHGGFNAAVPQDSTASPGSITSIIARDFTRLPIEDMDGILKQFPPDETLEMLIHAYFKNVHDDFPLFHRATFEDEYELFVVQARRRPHISLVRDSRQQQRPMPDWGWIGCLHMMLVFGSISNPKIPGIDHNNLRRKSVTAARTLLPQFISKCTLTNVRVLLLLSLFLHNNNERNAAWNLVGTATRISFALGLHRSNMMRSLRPLEREVRKWVFCTLYAFEQFLASSLGRPSGLQEVDVEIVPPREGFLDGSSGTDAQLVRLSLKLQGILSKTRVMHLGKRHSTISPPAVEPPGVDDILNALRSWKREIAELPGFDLPWIKTGDFTSDGPTTIDMEELKMSLSWKTRAQLRAVLLVHIQYHYIAIVATRPLLLRDVALLRKGDRDHTEATSKGLLSEQAKVCVRSACQLAHIILLLDSFNIINGLCSLDVFYAYCAAMVLFLRLLRSPARIEGYGSNERQRREENVQSCLRSLVSQVQEVIGRVEKSGSMRRFAKVVDTFSEVVNKPSPRLPPGILAHSQHGSQTPQPSPQPGDQEHHDYNGQRVEDQMQGVSGFSFGSGPLEESLSAVTQFGDPSLGDGWLNFLPLSTFGSTGANEGMFAQFIDSDELNASQWTEVDGFF